MGSYRTWEDLDDEPATVVPPGSPSGPGIVGPPIEGTAEAIERLGAPPELVDLLRRKEELEAQLRQFAEGDQGPEDERRAKCFPVKVHTKESRIEERRLRRRDEQLAILNQRRLERAHRERLRAELDRQARLRQLESLLLARLEAERQDQAHRRALEQATLMRRRNDEQEEARERVRQEAERLLRAEALAAARREQQIAEEARLAEERAALLVRWEADLKAALARTRHEEEQQRVALARDEQLRREATVRRAAGARAARAAGERREMAQRALECRLRMARGARARAEERAFEARRDETSRLAQARQGASRRERRDEPPAMRER
jgi:hypothetical protein